MPATRPQWKALSRHAFLPFGDRQESCGDGTGRVNYRIQMGVVVIMDVGRYSVDKGRMLRSALHAPLCPSSVDFCAPKEGEVFGLPRESRLDGSHYLEPAWRYQRTAMAVASGYYPQSRTQPNYTSSELLPSKHLEVGPSTSDC